MKISKLLLFLCFVLPLLLCGQEYSFRSYGVRDGLSQSQVYSLLQDHRGFLWAGTRGGGLNRFDGKEFIRYSSRDGLSSNYISSLLQASDRTIWIGTDAGLNYYSGGSFIEVAELKGISVNSLSEDSRKRIWIATEEGLFFLFWRDAKLVVQQFDNSAIYALTSSKDGGIWAAGDPGVKKINTEDIPGDEIILAQDAIYNALLEDKDGRLWMGSFRDGIKVLSDSGLYTPSGLDPDHIVLSICETQDGIWLGTLNNGLIHWNEEVLETIDEKKGLANNQVRAIIEDSWNNLWVGTSGGGIARYYGKQIVHLNKESGLPGRQVYAISEDMEGKIWMGVGNEGLVYYNRDSSSIEQDSVLNDLKVKSLFRDSKDRMWVGSEGAGIEVFENDSSFSINGDDGLGGAWVRDIEEDSKGRIWVATAGGGISRLTQLAEGKAFDIKVYNRFSGLKDDRINTICPDSLDRIWYGTESGGLGVIFPDETVLSFDNEMSACGGNIRALAIDNRSWLWIGSGDKGLSRIDLKAEAISIETLPMELQPALRNVYLICPDDIGQVWVGTNDGVYRYSGYPIPEYRHFSAEEGFLGTESCTNACYLDEQGELWIGTVDGVNCIYPSRDPGQGGAPKPSIEDITLYYKSLRNTDLSYFIGDWGVPRDTLVFTYDQNHLGFDLNAVRLSNPEQVYYQWWMQGLDSTWTPLLKLKTATFSNLNPGDYVFRYRVCNENGNCEEGHYTVIRILQPFWQKSSYRWAAALALLLLISALFLWRLRIVKERSREKNDRLLLQNKVLELEQQALRLQMNPHFIFNTLNSIQGLISLSDTREARKQLSRFAKLMRKTLENSAEELIPLSEELDSCSDYAELEKHARNLDFQLVIRNEVEHDAWIPPLIIQPFVENAILHGIQGIDRKAEILIHCREEGNSLLISIVDNGKGRAQSSAEPKSHKSLGMTVTRERIVQDGKGGTLEIEDLRNADGKQCGTAIHICIFEAINT